MVLENLTYGGKPVHTYLTRIHPDDRHQRIADIYAQEMVRTSGSSVIVPWLLGDIISDGISYSLLTSGMSDMLWSRFKRECKDIKHIHKEWVCRLEQSQLSDLVIPLPRRVFDATIFLHRKIFQFEHNLSDGAVPSDLPKEITERITALYTHTSEISV